MPELKKNFTAGKMNKDLDERLVPNGEYRDAMNIQVRTTSGDSEGEGDSGVIQNIQGNTNVLDKIHIAYSYQTKKNSTAIIGSVADEKTNSAYFFAGAPELNESIFPVSNIDGEQIFIDTIAEVKTKTANETGGTVLDDDLPDVRAVVVDKWAVVNTHEGVFGDLDPFVGSNSDNEFMKLTVLDGSKYRVGMTVMAYAENGYPLLQRGTEIQSIDGNILYLYDEHPQIASQQGGGVPAYWVFEAPRVLNFKNSVRGKNNNIHAINIIDNLLFWTDGKKDPRTGKLTGSEPKKINIDRCKSGTGLGNWTRHTRLKLSNPTNSDALQDFTDIEESLSAAINDDLKEEHITVIRKAPVYAPTLEMRETDRVIETEWLGETAASIEISGLSYDFFGIADAADDEFEQGYSLTIVDNNLLAGFWAPDWRVGDRLKFTEELLGDNKGVIKAIITEYEQDGEIELTILSINQAYAPANIEIEGSGVWTVELEQRKPLFELKLGRFAYRYKYEDNEYSSFSPWSEVAFLPGGYDYNYKKGYNLGMVNHLRSLKIKNFIPYQRTRPSDVVAVDILYKTTQSPNVYVVRTITRGRDPEWDLFTPTSENNATLVFGELTVTSEMIHKVVEKQQLLRAYDNVPRYALAQEIAANRLVFSNYMQGYDVQDHVGLKQTLLNYNNASEATPKKSVKSLRNYKFGMVFGDKYGRETTVMSNGYVTGSSVNNYTMLDGDLFVEKEFSKFKNCFQLKQMWDTEQTSGTPDEWIEYVKYYVKETSNEYYNLIMDRWYEAEDGNVWLSFVSADRNKLDEETYLILKKEHGNNEAVAQKARYKILAIKNEPPDFIQLDHRGMGRVALTSASYETMFVTTDPDAVDPDELAPFLLMTEKHVDIGADWQGFLDDYTPKGNLKVRIVGVNGTSDDATELHSRKWETVTYHGPSDAALDGDGNPVGGTVRWQNPFGEQADMVDRFNSIGENVSNLRYFLEFKEEVVDATQPRFDGKFFVKVERDDVLETKVMKMTGESVDYDNVTEWTLGFISSQTIHPTPNPNSKFYGYPWFSNSATWTESPLGVNISTGAGSNRGPILGSDQGWGDLGGSGWPGKKLGGALMALGCDTYVDSGLPASATSGFGVGGSTLSGCCGPQGAFTFTQHGSSFVINFAKQTRGFWNWVKDTVHPHAKYKAFIDNCRATYLTMSGSNQDCYSTRNRDYPGECNYADWYRPTGLDRGYLSGSISGNPDTYNQVGEGEWGRMAISGVNIEDSWGFFGALEADLKSHMVAGGMFSFGGDPNDYVYRVVGNRDYFFTNSARNFSKQGNEYADFDSSVYEANCAFNSFSDGGSVNGTMTNYLDDIIGDDQEGRGGEEDYNQTGSNYSVDQWAVGGNRPSAYNSCGTCSSDGVSSSFCYRHGFRVEFRRVDKATGELEGDGDVGLDPMEWDPTGRICHDGRESLKIYKVASYTTGSEVVKPVKDAAVWETEPKEDVGLDIYYEASNAIPMNLTSENTPFFAPYHSRVSLKSSANSGMQDVGSSTMNIPEARARVGAIGYTKNTSIILVEILNQQDGYKEYIPYAEEPEGDSWNNDIPDSNWPEPLDDAYIGRHLVFEHPDGTKTLSRITRYMRPVRFEEGTDQPIDIDYPYHIPNDEAPETNPWEFGNFNWNDVNMLKEFTFRPTSVKTGWYEIDSEVWKYPVQLAWHNCWSFGNGLESDRIRDDYNAERLDNGVKVSTTFLDYGEESKGSGMIYSGIYNSISGVNNLNEFNMAEKITKDLNPSYGSIQALKTRDTDMIVFTEDKVLKVTTNKDALFNADGNAQLLASNRVLGTAVPFSGDYGISNNPESLAWDQFRLYFTDMQRGAVLRLSGNGITPISNVGMKSYFRKELPTTKSLLGTFDVVNGEYNLTMHSYDEKSSKTISFNEGTKGWVSFKSFIASEGVSVGGKYLTSNSSIGGKTGVWQHHYDEIDDNTNSPTYNQVNNRNTFYGLHSNSTVDILFNDMPSSVKTFRTVNYEGSQARVYEFVDANAQLPDNTVEFIPGDNEYYNLTSEDGWYVSNITTDLSDGKAREGGSVEFKGKEGKWFNKIRGGGKQSRDLVDQDLSEFSVQGIGYMSAAGQIYETTPTLLFLSGDMENSADPDVTDSNNNNGPPDIDGINDPGFGSVSDVLSSD
tara:strand:- start:15455 stop:21904 length:6450 start_codon:yes stop_codon:yes gene_type:complete